MHYQGEEIKRFFHNNTMQQWEQQADGQKLSHKPTYFFSIMGSFFFWQRFKTQFPVALPISMTITWVSPWAWVCRMGWSPLNGWPARWWMEACSQRSVWHFLFLKKCKKHTNTQVNSYSDAFCPLKDQLFKIVVFICWKRNC